MPEIDFKLDLEFTENGYIIMPRGRFVGQPITRVNVNYLFWMVNDGFLSEYAEKELNRRGTKLPTCEVSPHAINRLSLKFLGIWKRTRYEEEGLHAWAMRMVKQAIEYGTLLTEERYLYINIVWVIKYFDKWPVLKTVFYLSKRKRV